MTRSLLIPVTTLLLVPGCDGEDGEAQPGELFDSSGAVGFEIATSIGNAPHMALVRAVDELGVAVLAEPVELVVDEDPFEVRFDPAGYGGLLLSEPGSVVLEDALGEVVVHAVDSRWSGLDLLPATALPVEPLAVSAAAGGALVASADEVWWVGLGLPSHPVLRFPVGEAFGGLRTLHVDDDGVLDAVVWTEAAVYALRGRPGGGMTWGVGLRGDGYSVGSATMGDVSGDGLADLVVAWAGSRGDRLQILEGNGRWRFDETTPQHLRAAPMDVVVGDNIDEGLAQITVLLDDGDWARLARGERDYLGAGPDLKLDFEVGTTMESAPDINGDGGDELLFFAPYVEGAQREVRLYDLVGRLQFLPITVLGGRFSLADSDRDGLTELWMLDAEHKLVHLRWGESQYRQRKVGQVTEHGLLAAGDVDGDRVADAFVAGELGRWWLGTNDLGEDAELWWGVDSPSTGRWAVGALGPVARAELDEDPTTFELVALRDDGGIVLQAWAAVAGAPAQIQDEGAVAVEVGEAPDLAACGEVAWVATGTELVRVDLVPSPEVAGQVEIAATRVDCGVGPQGAEVAVLVGDEVVLYDGDLVELGREDAPEARDLALVDLGGGASVETCAGEGCRAVAWTWGALGEQAVAVSTAEGIEVTTAAGAAFLPGRGELSTGDADGDGHDDLLVATADGAIGVFRSTGQGFGPGSFGHLERVLIGPALVADATGDGLPDAWIVEDDGDLAHTTAP